LHGWLGIEPTTTILDLSSQSGAYDLSATATPLFRILLSTILPRSSGWTPKSNNGRALQVEKKYPMDSGCSVPDVFEQISALQHTWFSITYDFVWQAQPFIHFKVCPDVISY